MAASEMTITVISRDCCPDVCKSESTRGGNRRNYIHSAAPTSALKAFTKIDFSIPKYKDAKPPKTGVQGKTRGKRAKATTDGPLWSGQSCPKRVPRSKKTQAPGPSPRTEELACMSLN